jgi:hypothetical protein
MEFKYTKSDEVSMKRHTSEVKSDIPPSYTKWILEYWKGV